MKIQNDVLDVIAKEVNTLPLIGTRVLNVTESEIIYEFDKKINKSI